MKFKLGFLQFRNVQVGCPSSAFSSRGGSVGKFGRESSNLKFRRFGRVSVNSSRSALSKLSRAMKSTFTIYSSG